MFDISVIIVTYNQEKTVAEALESIKYQLETYGVKESIQLIIADDGSEDHTVVVIEKWLYDNRKLFASVCELFSKQNRGICKNFANACRKAKGKRIITLAGDDMWANTNVIKTLLACGDKMIIACPPLKFKNGELLLDKKLYYYQIRNALYNKKEIIQRSRFCCPIVNGAIIGAGMLSDEEVLAFSEKFDLLDDQARFIKMFEKYHDFEYKYDETPVMLYRISDKQVTNTANPLHERIVKDKIKLTKYALQKEKRLSMRITIKCEELKVTNPKLYRKIRYFVNWKAYCNILHYIRNLPKIVRIAEKMVGVGVDNDMNSYLHDICDRAKRYAVE